MKLRCKCGNFRVDWDTSIHPLVARVCGCDYCSIRKSEYVSDPDSTVKFRVTDEYLHKIVQHGHNTADFHECKNCGVVIVVSTIDGRKYCVINAKALGLNEYGLDPAIKDYSDESIQDRLARRKRNWCKVPASP